MDSRLRGNDENEIGNDGGEGGNQSFATPSLCVGMHTSPDVGVLRQPQRRESFRLS
ncbi:hypothetical protein [Endozoicomonas sp. ALB122]|uniref:hypothetical protein n=1 Tax=Endozoicomonas sp. ALB122 TaxID=3403075 RepID=UPI003BB59D57